MSWQDAEKECFEYIKTMYPDAILKGGYNSQQSDIYIPSINKYIEVKDLTSGCRLGQFVERKASDIERKIISGDYTQQDLILGVKQKYQNKQVIGFCVKEKNGSIRYFSLDSFLNVYGPQIKLQCYPKRSGSRSLPKKDIKLFQKYPSFFWDDSQKKGFISDSSLWDTYSDEKEIAEYYINKTGEIRKRGISKTFTYLYALFGG